MLASFEKIDSYGILDANKSKFALETQKFYSMLDTLCLCQFAWGPSWQLYGPQDLIAFCKYGVGWETSVEELQEIGERRINMMRLFNAKVGFDRAKDKLPKKAFIPIHYGEGEVASIVEEDFEKALDAYYEMAGWDKSTGLPTEETKKRLGLEWIK
jgi:aldehyde:ferredoxin oxidoreductase